MAQDIHVTSSAIQKLINTINSEHKPFFESVKRNIDDTDIQFPGFGVVGLAFMSDSYRYVQDDMREIMQSAVELMESWASSLQTVKQNWEAAENNSQVKYR